MQLQLPSLRAANTIAGSALKLLVVLWALLAVAAVFVMTLGTDEAWVLNGLRSVLRPQVPDLSTEVVSTSGGAFALVNLGIEQLAGSKVWSHRLVSLLCLGLSFALVLKRRAGKETPASIDWLMLAPLIAIPGAPRCTSGPLKVRHSACVLSAADCFTGWPRRPDSIWCCSGRLS
ncbi:MAG: hypothetical protein E6H58_19750 [Betaproteobacteria bacterium]|nr:MAG: hypothetical protein E6H58_19750 [Betaproteobacteria bacterium]